MQTSEVCVLASQLLQVYWAIGSPAHSLAGNLFSWIPELFLGNAAGTFLKV